LSTNQRLIETNILALQEGAKLLSVLKINQYTEGFKPAFQSTIGAHFRHVLEHYKCFFKQVESGRFCYDERERDSTLECDVDYAEKTITQLINLFEGFDKSQFDNPYTIDDEQSQGAVVTTLQRELLFLQSHTVHHYAIIGAMTRAFGNQPADDFGVAIATRTHQKKHNNDTNTGDISPAMSCFLIVTNVYLAVVQSCRRFKLVMILTISRQQTPMLVVPGSQSINTV